MQMCRKLPIYKHPKPFQNELLETPNDVSQKQARIDLSYNNILCDKGLANTLCSFIFKFRVPPRLILILAKSCP